VPGHTIKTQGFGVYPALQALDGLDRHTPLCGDSTGRETAAQPVKDCQPFQAGQGLAVGGSRRKFTQSFQFFRYWRFSKNRWLTTFGASMGHSLPLSRRQRVVDGLFIRYARLNFSDSLNFTPV